MALDAEYTYHDDFEVSKQVIDDFNEYGYILLRNLLNDKEVAKLREALNSDHGVRQHAYKIGNKETPFKMCLWNHPGNDVTGMVARCEKVVTTSEQLLGGEVYHYHTKLMMKEPQIGGAADWHQDYGYWYRYGNLMPDMLTVFIPIDECTKNNGCLQIIPRSHKCGRIDHTVTGGQTGADMERVDHVKALLGVAHVQMNPGDALFFHCNLLHRSDVNTSLQRRWAFLMAYNMAANNPVYEHMCPQYTPLTKVANSAILDCSDVTDMEGKDFLDPKIDPGVVLIEDK